MKAGDFPDSIKTPAKCEAHLVESNFQTRFGNWLF